MPAPNMSGRSLAWLMRGARGLGCGKLTRNPCVWPPPGGCGSDRLRGVPIAPEALPDVPRALKRIIAGMVAGCADPRKP